MRVLPKILLGISSVIVVGLGAVSYQLSEKLINPFNGISVGEPKCKDWHKQKAYVRFSKDLSVQQPPVDMLCEDAVKLPADVFFAKTPSEMKIRYKVYGNKIEKSAYPNDTNGNKAAPIWLHVHGVTGSSLDGARYYKAAGRLGFQLAAMELSNHGLSDNNSKGAAYGCREKADVLAVFEDLKRTHPNRDILITATSMGAMSVINASADLAKSDTSRQLVAYALENPITSVRGIVDEGKQTPPIPKFMLNLGLMLADYRSGYDFETCAPVNHVKGFNVPVLVQGSVEDELVPTQMPQKIFDSLPQGLPKAFKMYHDGWHSASWNGQPEEFEADVKSIWETGLRYRSEFVLSQTH